MHTIASDGEMTAMEILHCANELQLTEISITDHDAVGAYTNEVIDQAKKIKCSSPCFWRPGSEPKNANIMFNVAFPNSFF